MYCTYFKGHSIKDTTRINMIGAATVSVVDVCLNVDKIPVWVSTCQALQQRLLWSVDRDVDLQSKSIVICKDLYSATV